MFYLKVKNLEERTKLLEYLKQNNILAVFHYIPLHSAPAGLKFGKFEGDDNFTTIESEKLIRLPMYCNLENSSLKFIINKIKKFYEFS